MFKIFPKYSEEEDENQRETDHQKRGGDKLYLEIPPRKELDDKKQKGAENGYYKPVDDSVKKGQLPQKQEIKGEVHVDR